MRGLLTLLSALLYERSVNTDIRPLYPTVATSEFDMPCVHGNEYPAYGPSGYLASTITESQHIGGERCPWTVSVQQGQRVNLTLMNFSVPEVEDSNSLRCPVGGNINVQTLTSIINY